MFCQPFAKRAAKTGWITEPYRGVSPIRYCGTQLSGRQATIPFSDQDVQPDTGLLGKLAEAFDKLAGGFRRAVPKVDLASVGLYDQSDNGQHPVSLGEMAMGELFYECENNQNNSRIELSTCSGRPRWDVSHSTNWERGACVPPAGLTNLPQATIHFGTTVHNH